jgi:tellurite resistance protein TerC
MSGQIYLWIGFAVLVVGALAIDLGVFQRKAHAVMAREALIWVCVWVSLALCFGVALHFFRPGEYLTHVEGPSLSGELAKGGEVPEALRAEFDKRKDTRLSAEAAVEPGKEEDTWRIVDGKRAYLLVPEGEGVTVYAEESVALLFLAGYIIEYSLSVDNLFVFIVIFSAFGVPREYEPKVLLWGILGAVFMRAIFIFAGVALINMFAWMMYVFAGILFLTGLKILLKKDEKMEPERNVVVRLFKRWFGTSDRIDGPGFFTKLNGKTVATPLFIVLLVVETTDVIFAVDSVPAILAVTRDPLIVYSSNVFAILGLRALYFVLSRVMAMFRFLKYGLAIVLWLVGLKMVLAHTAYKIPTEWSLGALAVILGTCVALSMLIKKKPEGENPEAS